MKQRNAKFVKFSMLLLLGCFAVQPAFADDSLSQCNTDLQTLKNEIKKYSSTPASNSTDSSSSCDFTSLSYVKYNSETKKCTATCTGTCPEAAGAKTVTHQCAWDPSSPYSLIWYGYPGAL